MGQTKKIMRNREKDMQGYILLPFFHKMPVEAKTLPGLRQISGLLIWSKNYV